MSNVELYIRSSDGVHEITRTLAEDEVLRVGRAPKSGLAIGWDKQVSREHADVFWDGKMLHVKCVEAARNPIVYDGQVGRTLSIYEGDRFRIGTTTIGVATDVVEQETEFFAPSRGPASTADDVMEQGYSLGELHDVSFVNAQQQMELLSGLPDLISRSRSDEELGVHLGRLLLEAMPAAKGVAVAYFDPEQLPPEGAPPDALPKPVMTRIETRPEYEGRFRPSRRLILHTLTFLKSHMHVFSGGGSADFTMTDGLGWAFCAPIRGESSRGWCLYVSGKGAADGGMIVAEESLMADLRFTELVAQFIGSVRQVRVLQEQKTQLSSFFSPNVIESLINDKDVLTPAERPISVLFCDVRGFSRKAEMMAHDLKALLESVSAALSVMANGILNRSGTIADFQGDAALGFWGWPVELEDGPVPACHAALDIYRGFLAGAEDPSSLLHGFSVGMGVVHGRAIAGQIGTTTQAKVGVFGPVVNQGARLEGLTKQLGVPICIDEATAEWISRSLKPEEGRLRRLARVRPKGMDVAVQVFGLLLPADAFPGVTDETIALHEQALDAVIAGDWSQARQILDGIPAEDGPRRFLLDEMARHNNQPPSDWDGAFTLSSK